MSWYQTRAKRRVNTECTQARLMGYMQLCHQGYLNYFLVLPYYYFLSSFVFSYCYLCFNLFKFYSCIIHSWCELTYVIVIVTVSAFVFKNVTTPCGTVLTCNFFYSLFLTNSVCQPQGYSFSSKSLLSKCHPKAKRTSSI